MIRGKFFARKHVIQLLESKLGNLNVANNVVIFSLYLLIITETFFAANLVFINTTLELKFKKRVKNVIFFSILDHAKHIEFIALENVCM